MLVFRKYLRTNKWDSRTWKNCYSKNKNDVNKKLRSSHPEVFPGKCVLKICSKFTGEHTCWSAISIKLDFNKVALQLYWNRTSAWVLLCKFAVYFQNTSGWLLLKVHELPRWLFSFFGILVAHFDHLLSDMVDYSPCYLHQNDIASWLILYTINLYSCSGRYKDHSRGFSYIWEETTQLSGKQSK